MRIFVSSTFEDLREHREAAIRGLRQLGHDVVAMEDFTAASAPPVQVVLERVGECDAYLGIFAWRYGYKPKYDSGLPPGTVLPKGVIENETSITHMEYLQAKQLDKPILAFLLEEKAPWPPHKIDAFAQTLQIAEQTSSPMAGGVRPPGAAIRELRQQLQQERIVAFFKSPADLEARVTTAVTNLGMSLGVITNLVHLANPVSAVPDSSMFGEIRPEIENASRTGQRVSTIDIATGWWMTRLYFLSSLAWEFTDIERIVVVDGAEFVGMLSVSSIINRLEPIEPKLARFNKKLRGTRTQFSDQTRALNSAEAKWQKLLPPNDEAHNPVQVTRPNLATWFGDAMLTDVVDVDELERATLLDLVRILGYPNNFVPVRTRRPTRARPTKPDPIPRWAEAPVTLIDKRALNDQLAEKYLEELMDRARLR